MKNKFAIMIISHKRANTLLTYETLKKVGYTGTIYIIIDNKDPQIEEYKTKYGDIIQIFDKDIILKKSETIDNFENKTNALLPSLYCKQLAEQLKLDYYMKIDDDINSIRERFEKDGKLKGRDIYNLDKIIQLFINYMQNTNICCLSFGTERGYIGGANGKFKNGLGRNNNQNFIFKTKENLEFLGTRNEDFNMLSKYSNIGKLIFEVYRIGVNSPERGSNEGGLQQDYETAGFYTANFYSIIVAPYCCKLINKNNKFTLKREWNKFAPKIISEEYKK